MRHNENDTENEKQVTIYSEEPNVREPDIQWGNSNETETEIDGERKYMNGQTMWHCSQPM